MDITSRFSGNGNGCVVEESPGAQVHGVSGVNGVGDGVKAGRERARNGESGGESAERDEAGRFVSGNRGGPGNPFARRVAKLKMWLAEVVDEAGIKAVGKKLMEMAIDGQVAAARVLFQYAMPKNVDPDQMDLEEWEGYKKSAGMMAEMPMLVNKPASELALDIVRAAQPLATDNWRRMTANALLTPQSKLDEVLAMLKNDPQAAREYLDKGPGEFFGKKKARKSGTKQAENGGSKRAKR